MAFILLALGIVIAIIVLGLVFVPMLIDEAAIIELAQEQVRAATGGDLIVEGGAEIALLPSVELQLGDTTLDLPPQSADAGRILANIGNVSIDLSLLDLLTGSGDFGEVALTDANVQLFSPEGELQTEIQLEELAAQGLSIADQPVGLRATVKVVNLEGGEPLTVKMKGTVRIPAEIDRVKIDNLTTTITGALSKPVVSELSGLVNLAPLKADLDLLAQTPGGDINGDLIYAVAQSPQIDLAFKTSELNLDKLEPANPASSADEAAVVEETQPSPKAPPVPLPVGPLKDLDLKLAIDADSLITAGQNITNAQLLLRVVDGVTNLNYLRGVLHQGQLDTRATIDVRKPEIDAEISGGLKGVELDSLLVSLGSPDTARGRVDMAWDIETKGATVDTLKTGLEGDFSVRGNNVAVTAVSVQGQMCNAIAQVNQEKLTKPMPEITEVSALDMLVEFDEGQAQLEKLALAVQGVALNGRGSAKLDSLDFGATLTAKVGETLSELDPACRVNERYVAIDWPVVCRGNLTGDPNSWCAVDVQGIIKQLLENEAKSKLRKEVDKLGKDAGSVLKKLFGK